VYVVYIKVNLDFTSQKSDNINISLIDITGKLMISKKLHALSGVNSTDVNTSQLPSGIYILNIETTDGIIRKQVVK